MPPAADEPVVVLSEEPSELPRRLAITAALLVVGAVLLALPGRWSPYPSDGHVAGVAALLLPAIAAPQLVRRIRTGPRRLEVYDDHFWFSSRLGDATVPWATCGPFTAYRRGSSGAFRSSWGVRFAGIVERAPVGRRPGGTGWEAAVLPTRYGLDAADLAATLNAHRARAGATAAPSGSWDEQRPWTGQSAGRGRAIAVRVVVSVVAVSLAVTARVVLHEDRQPAASRCEPVYAALHDAADHLKAVGSSFADPAAAHALTADAAAVDGTEENATGELRAVLDRVRSDLSALATDLSANGDAADVVGHLDELTADVPPLRSACDAAT